MKIGIIGCGITGLSAAYELSKAGYEVEAFEAGSTLGGIAGAVGIDGFNIEKYYHHFFKSDKHIISLLSELGLSDKLLWKQSRMGYFSDGMPFEFGTPQSLLKFKPLSFMDKFRFGVSVLRLTASRDWHALEWITAKDWLVENAGRKAFDTVWKPLLVTKFGEDYDKVSMAWFWGKIKLRGTSKENGREVLGYIDGSSSLLFDILEKKLQDNGVKINLNSKVKAISRSGEGFSIETQQGVTGCDRVIAAVPLPIFGELAGDMLPQVYMKKIGAIKYTSVVCMLLTMKRPFGSFYWLNIGDESIPFGGLIEHTNLLDKSLYNNKNLLYISNYVYSDDKYYSMSDAELFREYLPHLKKINPEFEESWVESIHTYRDEYAQPVIKCGYSRLKPDFETPVPGLYTASMCNIYPEDRGVNYAVRDGKAVAALLMDDQIISNK